MQGHAPLTGVDRNQALNAYAELLLSADVDERNGFANAMLAWAEEDSQDCFNSLRQVVFEGELRRHSTDYAATFGRLGPTHDAGLAVAKVQYLVVRLGQGRYGEQVTFENYETFFGPDIPATLATLYQKGVKDLLLTR